MPLLTYGNAPVPWTVSWSFEQAFFVGRCPWFDRLAICQNSKPGVGVPRFGQPHAMRQREAMYRGLCDLCGRALRNSTKVVLSNYGGIVPSDAVLPAVEPLMHVECARTCLGHCPALRAQIREGRLGIRQVFRWRARPLLAEREALDRFLPNYVGEPLIGLAAIDLLSWRLL